MIKFFYKTLSIILWILLIFFLTQKSDVQNKKNNHKHGMKKTLENHIFYSTVINRISKKYNLEGSLLGIGSDVIKKKTNELSLFFICRKKLNLEETRELAIKLIYENLIVINKNTKLKNELDPFPFEEKNIGLSIFFESNSGLGHQPYPYIGLVLVTSKGIFYQRFEVEIAKYPCHEFQESFEEAFEKTKDKLPNEIKKYAQNLIAQKESKRT